MVAGSCRIGWDGRSNTNGQETDYSGYLSHQSDKLHSCGCVYIHFHWLMTRLLTWRVFCVSQLPRVRPRQEPATATSGTMMEGGMQLLNRDGHSISHNSKRHYHDSFVSMNRMRQRGLLCDIVLHVSSKEIKAHKVVLASCSPYFHAMFTSRFSKLTRLSDSFPYVCLSLTSLQRLPCCMHDSSGAEAQLMGNLHAH